jgi:hypothetical protein
MANFSSITRREFLKYMAVASASAGYGCAHTPDEKPGSAIPETPFTYEVRTQQNPNYKGRMFTYTKYCWSP